MVLWIILADFTDLWSVTSCFSKPVVWVQSVWKTLEVLSAPCLTAKGLYKGAALSSISWTSKITSTCAQVRSGGYRSPLIHVLAAGPPDETPQRDNNVIIIHLFFPFVPLGVDTAGRWYHYLSSCTSLFMSIFVCFLPTESSTFISRPLFPLLLLFEVLTHQTFPC